VCSSDLVAAVEDPEGPGTGTRLGSEQHRYGDADHGASECRRQGRCCGCRLCTGTCRARTRRDTPTVVDQRCYGYGPPPGSDGPCVGGVSPGQSSLARLAIAAFLLAA